MVNRVRFVKNVLCAAHLTKTGHTGSFDNVFVISQISVQNPSEIFGGVFRNEFSSHKGKLQGTNREYICLLPCTISLFLRASVQ